MVIGDNLIYWLIKHWRKMNMQQSYDTLKRSWEREKKKEKKGKKEKIIKSMIVIRNIDITLRW